MAKGWVTLNVREEIKERLQSIYSEDKKRPSNQKFTSWLDNMLFEMVDYDEKLRVYGAFLQVESLADNHVMLMDNWQRKRFFITISGSPMSPVYCQEDASDECIHVGFCIALPEVYKALIKKGHTPSKYYVFKTKGKKETKEQTLDTRSKDFQELQKKTVKRHALEADA